jgi:hypothetical protein
VPCDVAVHDLLLTENIEGNTQIPGLSKGKAITMYPPEVSPKPPEAGITATSRRGGLVKFKLEKVVRPKVPVPESRRTKS